MVSGLLVVPYCPLIAGCNTHPGARDWEHLEDGNPNAQRRAHVSSVALCFKFENGKTFVWKGERRGKSDWGSGVEKIAGEGKQIFYDRLVLTNLVENQTSDVSLRSIRPQSSSLAPL